MNDIGLKNEIELRMNPVDFTLSAGDLMDIINLYDVDEHAVALAYSEIVHEKQNELRDTTIEVLDYFREKGNYYPSYQEFKRQFSDFDDTHVNDSILNNLYKQELYDKNQTSLFEIVRQEILKVMNEEFENDDDFDAAAEKIKKQWGGEIKKHKNAGLSPEDIFDLADAGKVAQQDIAAEFGEDDFLPMSDDEYKALMGDLNEENAALFQIKDAEGNVIKRHALVTPVNGVDKKGRVMGFGDDGKGNMQLLVTWAWPTDMKFTNPEEMGDERVYPQDVVLAKSKNMNEGDEELPQADHPDGFSFDMSSLYKWLKDALWQLRYYDEATAAEIMEKAFRRDFAGKFNINEWEGPQPGDVEYHTDRPDEASGLSEFKHIDWAAIYPALVNNTKALKYKEPIDDITYSVNNFAEIGLSKEDLDLLEDRDIIYIWNGMPIIDDEKYLDYNTFLPAAKSAWEKGFSNTINEKSMKTENKKEEEINELDECGMEMESKDSEEQEELDESGRGLGKGVKNSGDRNVKLRDDHKSAPLTNLNESVDGSIKKLFEGKVTKKQLKDFINEEAKKVAKSLKG